MKIVIDTETALPVSSTQIGTQNLLNFLFYVCIETGSLVQLGANELTSYQPASIIFEKQSHKWLINQDND